MSMFCYQCQQTAQGKGCTQVGVCGKSAETSQLQDLLTGWYKHIAGARQQYRSLGRKSRMLDLFLLESIFSTLTNVNFDSKDITCRIYRANLINQLAEYLASEDYSPEGQVSLETQIRDYALDPSDEEVGELVAQAQDRLISLRAESLGEEVTGLQELILYGIRGCASYLWHIMTQEPALTGKINDQLLGMNHRCDNMVTHNNKDRSEKKQLKEEIKALGIEQEERYQQEVNLLDRLFEELAAIDLQGDSQLLLDAALRVGQINLEVMELLETIHIKLYGEPSPHSVKTSPEPGCAILVSGHDFQDLKLLLETVEGTDIKVYTHGEMLPAHSYPELRRFKNLVGHYGTAWCNQKKEFDAFPGAILMTTNCMMEPEGSYSDYIFTTGPVAWSGIKKIEVLDDGSKEDLSAPVKKDFSALIQAARDSGGYPSSYGSSKNKGSFLTVGYAADCITEQGMLDKIERAWRSGELRQIVFIGGCDGPQQVRSYYSQLASAVPAHCAVATCGCCKFRFNTNNFGMLSNFPRFWDLGQCNDTYGLIRTLNALSRAFGIELNQLPLSLFVAWFEQKAVAILLTLLALGVQNVWLGPTLPAFISPEIAALLKEKFQLHLITGNPAADLAASMTP